LDPAQRERIRDDLKGIVKGELLFDDLSRTLYSTDASIFEVRPLGVAVPRDEEDVRALVRYAAEHQVPLVPRGAGTGVAGESLGAGLIVDLSRHFRRIVAVGADTVRVQPGVAYRDLADRLAREGRRFAPDPALGECTLGGMLATNASGARAYRHGYTRDHVLGLRAVLDNGDAIEFGRHPVGIAPAEPSARLAQIVPAVAVLLDRHARLIRDNRPRTRFDRCGYLLHDVLDAGQLDLARLLVGSEGTLALFTEATLRTVPLPGGRTLVLLAFASLDAALRAVQATLPTGPSACELLDRRLLRLARGHDADVAALVPPSAEAVLLVEYEADSAVNARRAGRDLVAGLQGRSAAFRSASGSARPPLLAQIATGERDVERFWRVRQAAVPSLYGLRGSAQALPFVEDVGVPVESLAAYLHRVHEILQRHEMTASYLIHAASGQVHMRPFLDLQDPQDRARLWALADEVHGLVLDMGGTISAQHGTGIARTPWAGRQAGPLLPVWRELKAIFDPAGLFNPGKILGDVGGDIGGSIAAPSQTVSAWPLRRRLHREEAARTNEEQETEEAPSSISALRWSPGEVLAETRSCNGCGECRTETVGVRMCPVFRATHAEHATPRAKANLMRHLLQPDADQRLASNEVRELADLCVNCKMCASECPAHTNVPKLMLELKAANVAEHGMDRAELVLARAEEFAWLGSAFAPVANALLGNPVARWLMEKLFGLSRRRRLPGFAARSFLRRARQRGWDRPPRSARPRVAYFVDVFANYNDPLIAEAVVAVLHHNGIEVYVPPQQYGCGMAPLAHGDVEFAREIVQANLRVLADLAREGYPILCSEPTAALMLRHDALDLLDDPDARLVAAQTVECTAFLWDLHLQGHLRTDFSPLPLSVGHHVPCHLKALGRPPVGPALLGLVPQLRVRTIDVSCSGMAGTFGLQAANYELSLEAGRPMLQELSRPGVLFGSTECSTCRLQMEDGAGKRTLHPVQYLALAYGLLPELSQRLRKPLGKLLLR
jgi:FAD/FMN-containing dehydrogenase/Fe-S oxidoreductase